jgi:hypothetical protein
MWNCSLRPTSWSPKNIRWRATIKSESHEIWLDSDEITPSHFDIEAAPGYRRAAAVRCKHFNHEQQFVFLFRDQQWRRPGKVLPHSSRAISHHGNHARSGLFVMPL